MFVVTSQLQRDGGFGTFPSEHVFTMVVDGDQRTAIIGAAGEGTVHPLEPLASGALHISEAIRFGLPASCPGSSLTYSDLTFALSASGGLTGNGPGSGGGRHRRYRRSSAAATMSLTGVANAEPPRLNHVRRPADPFASFTVVASEPFQTNAIVVLARGERGDDPTLSTGGMSGIFVTRS